MQRSTLTPIWLHKALYKSSGLRPLRSPTAWMPRFHRSPAMRLPTPGICCSAFSSDALSFILHPPLRPITRPESIAQMFRTDRLCDCLSLSACGGRPCYDLAVRYIALYRAVYRLGHAPHFLDQPGELVRAERLRAVGECLFRAAVHFHDQAICARRNGRLGRRPNVFPTPCGVARIGNDR